jgi:hypothetical protein
MREKRLNERSDDIMKARNRQKRNGEKLNTKERIKQKQMKGMKRGGRRIRKKRNKE